MQLSQARQAVAAAAVSLLCAGAGVAAFLPPLNQHVIDSVPLIIMLCLFIAVSVIVHLVFIGLAARRLGRSPLWWVILAFLTFPLASIVGLILFEWFSDQQIVEQKTSQ